MWKRTTTAAMRQVRYFHPSRRRPEQNQAIIDIRDATFYRNYPSSTHPPQSNPALFPNLNFSLRDRGSGNTSGQYWAVISPSSLARTTFLQILAGQHICQPPTARTYPYLSTISATTYHAIKYVGFDAERGNSVGGTSVRGAYLSARYESRREETDFSVRDYLIGETELNALEREHDDEEVQILRDVCKHLNLEGLLSMPVANLSNGQTRRARIAKALMARPEVLLLDGPFMGLDPNTLARMSDVLKDLATRQQPRLVMSLRPEDGVPDWINHLVVVGDDLKVFAQGLKDQIFEDASTTETTVLTHQIVQSANLGHKPAEHTRLSRDGFPASSPALPPGEALVEMSGVRVAYGSKVVLGDWNETTSNDPRPGLHWSLHRGQRAGIFGANGSGKTTMLSLITSDHPQTYSLPIKLFGRSRLPGPGEKGISLFDIQKRMGHSSPEVHAFFPKNLSVRRTLESAWADAPMAKPILNATAKAKVDACLRWFARELGPAEQVSTTNETLRRAFDPDEPSTFERLQPLKSSHAELTANDNDIAWAREWRFRDLSFSSQRLALFLRALVHTPDLVILDEALSGMDETTRDRALLFLSHGEKIHEVKRGKAIPSVVALMGKTEMQGLSPDQALLVISHAKEDVPGCVREWIRLPEPGEGAAPRIGTLQGPLELNPEGWDEIWG